MLYFLRSQGLTQSHIQTVSGTDERTLRRWEQELLPSSLTLEWVIRLWHERFQQQQSHSSS